MKMLCSSPPPPPPPQWNFWMNFLFFDYCSSAWSNISLNHVNELQILQNRLAHILLSADIRTPVNKMMEDLDWDKLTCRWEQQLLIQTFRCLYANCTCLYFFKLYFHLFYTYTRSQSRNSLVIPTWRTISGKGTFHYRASVLWNNLPPKLRVNLDIVWMNSRMLLLCKYFLW